MLRSGPTPQNGADATSVFYKNARSIETIETKVHNSTYTRRAGGVRTLGYPFPQGGAPQRCVSNGRTTERSRDGC